MVIRGIRGLISIRPEASMSRSRLTVVLSQAQGKQPEPPKGIGAVNVPDRMIYCLDLRDRNQHEPYVEEIRRIAAECKVRRDDAKPQAAPALVELGVSFRNGDAKPFAPEQLLEAP